jgi:hypothetical protein
MSNKVFRLLNVIVSWKLVDPCQQIINESCDLNKVFPCLPRNYNILNFKLTNLIRISQRCAVHIIAVS